MMRLGLLESSPARRQGFKAVFGSANEPVQERHNMADSGRRIRIPDPLALSLAAGASVRDAAARASVSERTAYRRLADPEFRRTVIEVRADFRERVLGQLTEASLEAVSNLRSIQGDPAAPFPARVAASRAILENAQRLAEAVDLEARVAALEEGSNSHAEVYAEAS
jgi:hypothetical protein